MFVGMFVVTVVFLAAVTGQAIEEFTLEGTNKPLYLSDTYNTSIWREIGDYK